MLEIIYRIYEVADDATRERMYQQRIDTGIWSSSSQSDNIELLMDCMVCESRDQFKDIIRDTYGDDIRFRYSRNMTPGQLYCIIIGEHCYTVERYFNKIEDTCTECGASIITYYGHPIGFSPSEIKYKFYGQQEHANCHFCSNTCKSRYENRIRAQLRPGDDDEFFVSRDMFSQSISGYIYKITKKSTQQFYIGQTKYAPMFRWAEHMKTERFPIENIEDYQFEVLRIVPTSENILDVEKQYIQSAYIADPEHSLNVACTSGLLDE